MSEEAIQAQAPSTKPVKMKPGRRLKTQRKLAASQTVKEDPPAKRDVVFPNSGWPSGRAIKIKIHANQEEGDTCYFKLGDSPGLYIRRNVEVIVPYEVKSILDDAVVDFPMCDLDSNPREVKHYTLKKTRFEYSYYGEVPWADYVKFRDDQKKKL